MSESIGQYDQGPVSIQQVASEVGAVVFGVNEAVNGIGTSATRTNEEGE